jgi:hypothetical protein
MDQAYLMFMLILCFTIRQEMIMSVTKIRDKVYHM